MTIILTILAELIFISFLILLLYHLKSRFGLAPLYVLVGANQLLQTILSTRIDLEIFGGLVVYISPTIIFTAGLFAILLIYIKEGAQITQRFIFSIIIVNISLSLLSTISNWQELILHDRVSNIFYSNFRILFAGIISLILDAFLMIILYEFLFTKFKFLNLFSRIVLTLLLILSFDSIVFVSISFGESPLFYSKLISHIFSKSIAALFFAIALWTYLRHLDKDKEEIGNEPEIKGREDIFSILTYKGKFEKLKIEKAISDEVLQKAIDDKTRELERSVRRFTILSSIRELRMDKFSTSEQGREFLEKVKEAFEIDICTIHLLKDEKLILLSSIGLSNHEKENILDSTTNYFKEIIRKKKSLVIEDTDQDEAIVNGRKEGLIKFYYKSCLGAPLVTGDKVIGVLKLYSRNVKRVFTNIEIEHLQLVATQLANLIENTRLFEQNEKHKEVLVKQIVARKKVEEAIKESEEKYRTLVEQASDGIIISNDNLVLLDVNEMICKMMGYTKEELLKLSIFDIAQQEPETAAARYKAFREGQSILQERVFNRKDGTSFPVEVSTITMKNGNYLSFVRDISDRKKAEKEKQLLLMRNQLTINNMLDGYILSDLNGKIIDTNPAYCKMSGYSKEELLQKYAYHLDANINEKEIRNLIAEIVKKKSIQLESRHWRKDKTMIEVEISVSTVHFEEEIFLAAFIRDITDRKKSEEQAKLTNEHLRQLTGHLQTIREEERSRIGQEIHDQLGQHLTVLKMDVSRLKKNIPQGKNKEQDLSEILSELDNCLQMVRKISADLRPSIIDDLGIIAALEWQAEDFERRTEISTKFYSNVSELKMPQTHSIGLFRIFQESLTNVARHADAKKVVTSLNKENGFLVMTISDNGKGFETNSIGGKRSLGLLGMRERTHLMNGNYEISSVPGKGTEVKVMVPYNY